MTSSDIAWASSEACTLPTTERPLRVAEFDDLFAATLTAVERPSPTRADLALRGDATLARQVRDLTAREDECCSFFTFDVEDAEGTVQLRIDVPPAHTDVLNALLSRAQQVSR